MKKEWHPMMDIGLDRVVDSPNGSFHVTDGDQSILNEIPDEVVITRLSQKDVSVGFNGCDQEGDICLILLGGTE